MHHISELDSLTPLKPIAEQEQAIFTLEKLPAGHSFAPSDSVFNHRRERIDSEDFILPPSKLNHETDFFQQELTNSKQMHFEDARARRKSSVCEVTDPTLLELEVS